MTESYEIKDINLLDQYKTPIHIYATDIGTEWKKIIIPDLLHAKLKEYPKAAFIMLEGFYADNPLMPCVFYFPKNTFAKELLTKFEIRCFQKDDIIKISMDLKKNNKGSIIIKEVKKEAKE